MYGIVVVSLVDGGGQIPVEGGFDSLNAPGGVINHLSPPARDVFIDGWF